MNRAGGEKGGKDPDHIVAFRKKGSAIEGGMIMEKNKQMVVYLSPRVPVNTALHSSQGSTAKSLEWSCATGGEMFVLT